MKDKKKSAAMTAKPAPELQRFETGATRMPVPEHMHYLCPEFEMGIARICAEGFANYPDPDAKDVELSTGRLGLTKANLIKHGSRHWALYRKGDRSEPHLFKVGWALMMLSHFECDPPCQHFNFLLDEAQHQNTIPKGFGKKNKELVK